MIHATIKYSPTTGLVQLYDPDLRAWTTLLPFADLRAELDRRAKALTPKPVKADITRELVDAWLSHNKPTRKPATRPLPTELVDLDLGFTI